MLENLRRREAAARARYEAGDISKLEWLGARLEQAAGELSRLEALVMTQQAVGELESALQSPLDESEWILRAPARPAGPAKEPADE